MSTVSTLAQMYRQRVPTSPTTNKVGPRKTTVEDVRRVATYGRAGMAPPARFQSVDPRPGGLSSMPSSRTFEMTPQIASDIQAGIVGGPGAGYGQKYGGFPTQSDYLAAIEGEAGQTRELANLAQMQAQKAVEARSREFTPEISSGLSRSASMAGVRPGATLSSADRAKLMGGYERVQEMGRTPEYQAIVNTNKTIPDPLTGERYNANQLMRIAYETMLDASRFPADEQSAIAQLAAEQNVNLPGVQRFSQFLSSPEIAGPRAMASEILNTPIYEYARQIAEARYGMDPNLAAGLFTPEMDMAYEQQQQDYARMQQGFFPVSEAENIFDNYGAEGYAQYREMLAEQAMFGSPSEQRAAQQAQIEAENLETDLNIEANYGFRPSAIPGYSAEAVRQAFFDQNFQNAVDATVKQLAEKQSFTRDDATKIYNDYLASTSGSAQGPINATILEAILKTFNTQNPDFG